MDTITGLEGLAAKADLNLDELPAPQRAMIERQRLAAKRVQAVMHLLTDDPQEVRKGNNPNGRPTKSTYVDGKWKCPHCDHVAVSRKKDTRHLWLNHQPVPQGKLCDFGCGQNATHTVSTGRYACAESAHFCPAIQQKRYAWKSAK